MNCSIRVGAVVVSPFPVFVVLFGTGSGDVHSRISADLLRLIGQTYEEGSPSMNRNSSARLTTVAFETNKWLSIYSAEEHTKVFVMNGGPPFQVSHMVASLAKLLDEFLCSH